MDKEELVSKSKESGNIGKIMAQSDFDDDSEITREEWDAMFKKYKNFHFLHSVIY